jgi:ubiquinone/menaquinone biosynthesis C-methylase UbiE
VTQVFDLVAEAYDQWYETPEGKALFDAELKCLRSLLGQSRGRWLEVGVGTGRFASSLGVAEGIDPSPRMLEIAASRGIEIHQGSAERLPFTEGSFDGILMALTLCFVANAPEALKECRRVLRPDGRLLLGILPADGPWGREYVEKASRGHPVYALGHFRTASEIVELCQAAGFALIGAASTLFWKPDERPRPRVERGVVSNAGFVALLFEKSAPESSSPSGSEGDG